MELTVVRPVLFCKRAVEIEAYPRIRCRMLQCAFLILRVCVSDLGVLGHVESGYLFVVRNA